MVIRTFQLSDYAETSQLFERVLCESCYTETMSAFARQLGWDSELVLVATADDRIVGAVIGTIDKNKAYYYRIAVDPEFRRQGIGRSLVGALKQRFVQRKVAKIMVAADEHNEAALPLYEAAGYKATDFFHKLGQLSIVGQH